MGVAGKSISTQETLDIIHDYCAEKDIELPKSFDNDFTTKLGNHDQFLRVASFRKGFCNRVTEILNGNESLRNKYGVIFSKIRHDIRTRIFTALGTEDFATNRRYKVENIHDSRRYLLEFLESLAEGQKWSYLSLVSWQSEDNVQGENVVGWIRDNLRGKFCEKTIRRVLGNDADKLLTRNPFEKREHINKLADARGYLTEFLESFQFTTWCVADLEERKSSDGATGISLVHWIRRHYGEITEKSVQKVLGKEKMNLLEQHKFIKVEMLIYNEKDARKYLLAFIRKLPEGESWSAQTLIDFGKVDPEGPDGNTLYRWLMAHYDIPFAEIVTHLVKSKEIHRLKPLTPYRPKRKIIPDAV